MCVCVLKGTCCWRSGSGGNLTNGGYKMVSMGDMMTVYVKKEHGPPTQWQSTGATSNISTTELGGVENNEHLQHKALAHKKTRACNLHSNRTPLTSVDFENVFLWYTNFSLGVWCCWSRVKGATRQGSVWFKLLDPAANVYDACTHQWVGGGWRSSQNPGGKGGDDSVYVPLTYLSLQCPVCIMSCEKVFTSPPGCMRLFLSGI